MHTHAHTRTDFACVDCGRWYPASLLLSLCCFSADAEDQDEDHDEGQDEDQDEDQDKDQSEDQGEDQSEDQDEDQDDKPRIKTKIKTTRRRSRQEKRTNKQTEDKAGSPYRHQHPHRHRSTPLMNTPSTSMPPLLSLLIIGADRRREAVHHSRCVRLRNSFCGSSAIWGPMTRVFLPAKSSAFASC